jgi:hypothetical protein
MRIEGLKKYQHRQSIEDLPEPYRSDAREWFHRIVRKRQSHGKPTREPWLRAILIGQAKRLALNPPTSAWGRSMLAKRGGHAVQHQYVLQGRTGNRHPAHRAAQVSASRRKWRAQQRAEKQQRDRLGLPPKPRWKHLPLG